MGPPRFLLPLLALETAAVRELPVSFREDEPRCTQWEALHPGFESWCQGAATRGPVGDVCRHACARAAAARDLPFSVDWRLLATPQGARPSALLDAPSGRARKRKRVVLWMHIHKSAGTFMCHLAGFAGENVVRPESNCNWEPHDMYGGSGSPSKGVSCQERERYFREHQYTWGQIERELFPSDRCWDNYTYGVMLREPLALMKSMMNWEPQIGKGFVTALRREIAAPRPAGRTQFPVWKIMDNYAVRLLAPALEVPAGQINETHYDQARETLSHFQYVQRLEDLPSTAGALFEELGWPAEMVGAIRHKQNAARTHRHDFTAEEAGWLREVNRYDIALYDSYR